MENKTMNFDLNSEIRRKLGHQLIDVVDDFFASLPDRPVQPAREDRFYPAHQDTLPETGEDPGKVFEEVCRELMEKGFHIPSAHYLGMMNPTPTYMAFLAESLVAVLNPQLATLARSQMASRIEAETVRWVGELVGWQTPFSGTFTTGGNEANLSALAMALGTKFPGVTEDGVCSIGAQPVFYTSVEGHHSLDRSAGLLGLGRKSLRRIAVTESLQLDPQQLEATIQQDLSDGKKPFCVVATAGTTSSGAIDDLPVIAEICRRHSLWLHVDGAYGAAVLFSNRYRGLVRGIEQADSVTFDPHKWLAMPFSAGLVLTTHVDALERTFSVPCSYLQKAPPGPLPDNLNIGAQWSRRMNSLKLWLTLRAHGRRAYEELIDRQMDLARSFADWVATSENFELAAPQVLPILNLHLKAREVSPLDRKTMHAAIIEEVNRDGQRWISGATVNGESVIRTMVISYLSEERHLRELQAALEASCIALRPLLKDEAGKLSKRAEDTGHMAVLFQAPPPNSVHRIVEESS
jgi:aromatic-L-amino-acid/L-tryptophan decarboxylase